MSIDLARSIEAARERGLLRTFEARAYPDPHYNGEEDEAAKTARLRGGLKGRQGHTRGIPLEEAIE